ncbi:hypothetical protein K439DRAFT_1083268 [Ramaria rubella]|nr:hypothetical protein K439DRAFT_1083268 [Ramaria rubella]
MTINAPADSGAVTSLKAPIWWSNSVFFVATHLAAFYGVLCVSPFSVTPKKSLVLATILWQLSCFGVTIGYHRLYSHRAFQATVGVRAVLAVLGSMAFQGSIKWWSLRHRLHHRFTDDPIHDPYCATRGLFFSHMGWIFYKPSYPRMELIDKNDLEQDPVVKYQHQNYIPMALFFGLILPAVMGYAWGDPIGAFIWAGLVARVITWHCTFLVNSFAHWDGLQKYSDEISARGNLIMALWTCGEGNHNFHAFPHDYRAGPATLDWDPSKWIIQLLHRLQLASRLRRAKDEDINYAMQQMRRKQQASQHDEHPSRLAITDDLEFQGLAWNRVEIKQHVQTHSSSCFLVVDEFLLDVTQYMGEHPGGAALLRTYSLHIDKEGDLIWQEATWAFQNLNNHSRIARKHVQLASKLTECRKKDRYCEQITIYDDAVSAY